MDWWERLPEPARWLLYVPAVFLTLGVLNLLQSLAMWLFNREGVVWTMAAGAAFSAGITFPVVFALAPRGKRIAGWVFYVALMLFCGAALLLLLGKRLGSWGLLGDALRAPPGFEWTSTDTGELLQSAIWLLVGTYSFRKCLEEERVAQARSLPAV